MARGKAHIGTSGWCYPHWSGPFYPEDLPSKDYFGYYAKRFSTVEINNTFYQLPEADAVKGWKRQAPRGFLYACKASRYATHMKKLKDPVESLEKFFDAVDPLGPRLGPVLFQLPPNWKVDAERLASFLGSLGDQRRYALEFRDPSWFTDEVYRLLEDHNCALCAYDLRGEQSPVETTADFCYIRLHGPAEHAYHGRYDGRTLNGWATRIENWLDDGRDVFCYFNNDHAGHAPEDAQRLLEMLES